MSWLTPQKEILIGVIGVTGAGKTTFISRATGKHDLQMGHSLESCTKDVLPVPCTIDGQRVLLIDTPGFDDTYESDADIMELIANYLATTYENKMFLSGLILLHPINGNRLTGSEKRRTALFKDVMGPDAYKRLIIGTTMWNQVRDRSIGDRHTNDRMMREDSWGDMCDGGAKVIHHEDTTESATSIVRHLVDVQGTMVLQLQKELAANNRNLWLTSAGKRAIADLGEEVVRLREALSKLERERLEHRMEIQDLNNRLAKCMSQRNRLLKMSAKVLQNLGLLSAATVPAVGMLLGGASLACNIL